MQHLQTLFRLADSAPVNRIEMGHLPSHMVSFGQKQLKKAVTTVMAIMFITSSPDIQNTKQSKIRKVCFSSENQ